MGEVKNAFISSKMNKDLDDRLLPSGEYRNAINAQVSKSEGSDVGALENVLGNKEVANLTNGVANVSSIGYFADEFSDNVYIFLTDNTSSSYIPTGPGSNHFIFSYNINNNVVTKLVEGAFLNFSKLNPIFGVNLLENLLFWTDNRNQPRKINIENPLGYYTIEEHISVAKYYPYRAIDLYSESALVTDEYESTMKDVVSKSLPNGGSATCSSVTNLSTFVINNLSIQVYPNVPQQGFTIGYVNSDGEIIDLQETVVSYNVGTNEITLTGNVTLGVSTELVLNINPYYDSSYPGDESFLEDKFVRFSYRFKFDDGEYSLIAPFTQVCFIPKQDGYFLNTTELEGDEKQAIESTIVEFMENKVNKINLQIPLPCAGENLLSDFHISSIDIIYKESDGLALQVVETILVENINTIENTFQFSYTSQKPYKTLPSNEVTRVYDKVPVKALAQEIISNRVVYGNYLDKNNPPSFLNYNIAATEKYDFNLSNNFTSSIEYPSSSLKTNRNYQVGIVLADKFGRQSTVILSNNKETITVAGISYSGSTLYSPYINEGVDEDAWKGNSLKILFREIINEGTYNGEVNDINYNPVGWYSYKVVVKQTEQDYYNIYTAGALKGNLSGSDLSSSYISLINDNINKIPRDLSEVGPTQSQFRSSVKLYGRVENTEINVSNTGNSQFFPGRKSFTTSTIQNVFELFDFYKTNQDITSTDEINVIYKSPSNPLVGQITTSQNSTNQFGTPITNSSHLPISNLAVFETDPDTSRLEIFWETSTSGVISELNEAITNSQENPSASNFSSFDTDLFDEGIEFDEDILTTDFYLVDFFGVTIPAVDVDNLELTVFTTDLTPQNVTNYFMLYEPTPGSRSYNIKVASDFLTNVYYGASSSKRVWKFNFTATVDGVSSIIQKTVSLLNLPPVIYIDPYTPATNFSVNKNPADSLIATLKATNGASIVDGDNLNTGKDLTWSIVSQVNSSNVSGNYFTFNSSNTDLLSTCNLTNNQVDTIIPSVYTVILRVTDAGGATDEVTITINMGVEILPGQVKNVEIIINFIDAWANPPDYDYVTIIEVTESNDLTQNGTYLFNQDWGNLGEGGGPVEIDYTNAIKDSSCSSSAFYWAFTDTGDAFDLIGDLINCYYVGVYNWQFYETVVDTSNNTFYIT